MTSVSSVVRRPDQATAARRAGRWPELGAVAAGGVVGSLARFGLHEAVPSVAGQFPWATFAVNVTGCLLIGVLMVLLTEVWAGRRLLRPFLGVGVLGGFTTFSAYAVEIEQAVSAGAARTALLYLGGTLVAAMLAVGAGAGLTGAAVRTVRRRTAARRTAAPKQIAHRPDRRRGPR